MTKPRLLLLDDDNGFASAVRRGLRNRLEITHVTSSGEAVSLLPVGFDIALVDIVLNEEFADVDRSGLEFVRLASEQYPDLPLIVLTGHGAEDVEVEALRAGAADYIEKGRLDLRLLEAKILALLERNQLRMRARQLENRLAEYEPRALIGESSTIQDIRRQIEQFAPSEATVFLTGETGVGKEVVARAIHDGGPRRRNSFVAVNCAALSGSLLEAELFGHERGAFTGADRVRPGTFEQAAGGTLLLDEITEFGSGLQAKLLRVLQEKQIRRVGGTVDLDIDVRVIATTNRDPEEAVRAGTLRQDLFFRLNVLRLSVPPLREHAEDIPELAERFLLRLSHRVARPARRVARDTLDLLRQYTWPGNVRELENILERAFTLCPGEEIPAALVGPWLVAEVVERSTIRTPDSLGLAGCAALAQMRAIAHALEQAEGAKEKAQMLLGISTRSTMRRTVQRLRDEFPSLWRQFPILEQCYPHSSLKATEGANSGEA